METFYFLFYVVTYLFIPGFALMAILWNDNNKGVNLITTITYSLVAGLAIEIFVALLSMLIIPVQFYIVRFYPLFFLLVIIYRILVSNKKILILFSPLTRNQWLEISVLFVIAGFYLSLFYINNVSLPAYAGAINIDLLYFQQIVNFWANNFYNNSFLIIKPGEFTDSVLHYHHFVFIHRAMAAINSGVSADLISFRFDGVLIFLITTMLIREISNHLSSKWYFSTLCLLSIFFVQGVGYVYALNITGHTIHSASSVYSFIFFLSFILLVLKTSDAKKYFWIYLAIFILLLGSKGSNGIIVILTYPLLILHRFFDKKDYKNPLMLYFSFLLIFVVQFYFQFRGEVQAPAVAEETFFIFKFDLPFETWLLIIVKRVIDFRVFFPILPLFLIYHNYKNNRQIAVFSSFYLVQLLFFLFVDFLAFVHPHNHGYFYANILLVSPFIVFYYLFEHQDRVFKWFKKLSFYFVFFILALNVGNNFLMGVSQLKNPNSLIISGKLPIPPDQRVVALIDYLNNNEIAGNFVYLKTDEPLKREDHKNFYRLGGFTKYNSVLKSRIQENNLLDSLIHRNPALEFENNALQAFIIQNEPDELKYILEKIESNDSFEIYMVR